MIVIVKKNAINLKLVKMNSLLKYLLFFCFLLTNCIVIGQTRSFEGETQTEMNLNAKKEFHKMDSVLTSMYNQIIQKNKSDTLFIKNFKKSQKTWLTWRECEVETFFPKYPDSKDFYGTMSPLCWYSKLMDWTEERIKHFKIYLNGVEKDDLCGYGRN